MRLETNASSCDDMLEVLANGQRRELLIALLEDNPQDDEHVILTSSATDPDTAERGVNMHHVHLPKLANLGFIEWNRERHFMEKGPNFDEIRPLLELLDNNEDKLPDDW